MAQQVQTRTIHTITIDVQDDVLSKIEEGDEVEVLLVSRYGATSSKKLTYRDIQRLVFLNLNDGRRG